MNDAVARYEYDPLGNATRRTGLKVASTPCRFSAKYTDDETGVVMCQLRPYAAGKLKDLLPKNG